MCSVEKFKTITYSLPLTTGTPDNSLYNNGHTKSHFLMFQVFE